MFVFVFLFILFVVVVGTDSTDRLCWKVCNDCDCVDKKEFTLEGDGRGDECVVSCRQMIGGE